MPRETGPERKIPKLAVLFAARMRQLREREGLSQAQLGARAGYTVGHISMLERGDRVPPLETIEHIARALGVSDPRLMFRGR
jgi:transcriptional regulator with XRE-family HTH domain